MTVFFKSFIIIILNLIDMRFNDNNNYLNDNIYLQYISQTLYKGIS